MAEDDSFYEHLALKMLRLLGRALARELAEMEGTEAQEPEEDPAPAKERGPQGLFELLEQAARERGRPPDRAPSASSPSKASGRPRLRQWSPERVRPGATPTVASQAQGTAWSFPRRDVNRRIVWRRALASAGRDTPDVRRTLDWLESEIATLRTRGEE